jgi:hypothetical protein
MAEVVRDRQAFDAPPVSQAIADEVHAPHLIDLLRDLERHTLMTGRFAFLRFFTASLAAL